MHNSYRLVKGKSRCDVLMHPDDAARFGIAEGDTVRVRGEAGEIELPARLSDEVMAGVISIPHGWGHGRQGVQLSVARKHAGASINDVIGTASVEMLTGMAVLNGVPVTVSKGTASASSR